MPSAFGFSIPYQQPTPDPRTVGAQLMQPREQQQQQQPQLEIDSADAVFPARTEGEALRRQASMLMGASGLGDDPSLVAAVADALTRAGGGHRGNPNPHKDRDRHVQRLQQLGISELEAELLREVI